MPAHENRAHARLSPSATERWWNCAASVRATEGIPSTSSIYAREGTAAHEMAQECLEKGFDASAFLGDLLDGEFLVDEDFASAVQVYLDLCRSYMEDGWEFWFEERITLIPLAGDNPDDEIVKDIFGTADFSAYSPIEKRLVTVDLKFGKGKNVSVEDNKQVMVYTLGRWLSLQKEKEVDKITMVICQPRTPIGEKTKTAELTPFELAEWAGELIEHAKATQNPEATFVTGPWCGFCPLSGRCTGQAEAALASAELEFESCLQDSTALTVPEVRLLTEEQIGRILTNAPMIEDFIKSVKEVARKGLEENWLHLSDWKLVQGRGKDVWLAEDPETTAYALTTGLGLTDEQIWTKNLLSYPKARDILTERIRAEKGLKAKEARLEAVDILKSIADKKAGGIALVASSDPRPSVTTIKGDEFVDLLDKPE